MSDNLLPEPAEPIEKKLEKGQFIAKVRRMKYCSDRCPAYDFCPSMPMAQNQKTERKPCMLRAMPEKMKKRFERLFLQGQDGIVKELLTAVYTVGMKTDVEGELSDHRAYANMLMGVVKTIYGEKVDQPDQVSTVTVNVISLEDTMPQPETKEIEGEVITVKPMEKTDEEMLDEYVTKWVD
ncbi:MAG: hypothetical protein BWY45_02730 [Euryarchaeota archaeon ADurb.Bin294]|jgi:hypothetical protein|nr:MAG: hypothetical protein BWY45_02730 [Euryarchaeota archaeon ADurb.Bin294]